MSRTIKFRAWVNDHWVDWIPTCKTLGAYNASIIDTDGYTFEEDNPFIVEQYTGLKDRNGKEIYEGDVVKAKIDGVWETSPSCISFGKATWSLICYWDEKRYAFMWHIIGSKNYPDRVYDFYDYHISDIEVMGNIHENPELIA